MRNKEIASAVIGSTFFAIPYLGLSFALAPALVIGCAAFGASELVLSGMVNKESLKEKDLPLYLKINTAKKQNKELYNLINKLESIETSNALRSIYDTVDKIIKTVETNSEKGTKINNFFDYYLPVLLKIVNKYDEVENQKLVSEDGKTFMTKADKMIKETDLAFKSILASLYQKDIMDVDADMKVYNLMLKADGIVDENSIMKGSDKIEK